MSRHAAAVLVGIAALFTAGPLRAQTIFARDTFTVASNTLLESHTPEAGGPWTKFTGNGITINAAADNARNVSTGDWSVYGLANAPSAEYVVGATVTFSTGSVNNFLDLFGRTSASFLDSYNAHVAANGSVQLIRYSGGTPTVLASTAAPALTGTH